MNRKESIDRLIERSSLGTSAAKKVRARTPKEQRAAILRTATNKRKAEAMSEKKNVWVVRDGDEWVVRRESAPRASSRHDTQAEALDRARDTARRERVEMIWQGRDGKIIGRNSYGNDPHPPKG